MKKCRRGAHVTDNRCNAQGRGKQKDVQVSQREFCLEPVRRKWKSVK